jgi:hypothetical protein
MQLTALRAAADAERSLGVVNLDSHLFAVAFAIATVATPCSAGQEAGGCSKLPPRSQYNPPNASTLGCQCGSKVDNAVITLKKPFRLQAVCSLRWARASGDSVVDLSAERITFDSFTNGDHPVGELLLIGNATLQGTLRFDPGPAGEYWFTLNHSLGVRGPAELLLGEFKLSRKHSPSELRVPTSLRSADCWMADATLDVSNIWLVIGDSDEAGAYPSSYKVLSIAGHRSCQ